MQENANVKLSTKSWHYQFMKFVLGAFAPTSENMFNLCPYFWLLIASITFSPIILPIKGIVFVINKFANFVTNSIESMIIIPSVEAWEKGLSDIDVYQIYITDKKISKMFIKLHLNEYDYPGDQRRNFIEKWFKEKYNKDVWIETINSNGERSTMYSDTFVNWLKEQAKILNKIYVDVRIKEQEEKAILKKKRENSFIRNFENWFDNFRLKIASWQTLIVWIKRFVGTLITISGLAITFVIVNFISSGALWLVDNWVWQTFWAMLLVFGILVILIGIAIVMSFWVEYIKEHKLKLWYARLIYYFLYYVFYVPIKFFFYDFLFLIIGVNLALFILNSGKLVWKSLLGFLGIFGEYFGASYSDYCPGIEWVEEKTDK